MLASNFHRQILTLVFTQLVNLFHGKFLDVFLVREKFIIKLDNYDGDFSLGADMKVIRSQAVTQHRKSNEIPMKKVEEKRVEESDSGDEETVIEETQTIIKTITRKKGKNKSVRFKKFQKEVLVGWKMHWLFEQEKISFLC